MESGYKKSIWRVDIKSGYGEWIWRVDIKSRYESGVDG